jgi:hypothetical protein
MRAIMPREVVGSYSYAGTAMQIRTQLPRGEDSRNYDENGTPLQASRSGSQLVGFSQHTRHQS